MSKTTNLFDEEMAAPVGRKAVSRKTAFEDYEGFVEKFKPKKTTDNCYTPEPVYEAIKGWVSANLMPLDGVEVVRPCWPGGDYEGHDYPEGCLVLDNPPFSILAKIRRFYSARGIRYFLFGPTLKLASSAQELDDTYIICKAKITYENGAVVPTSFITNIPNDVRIWCAGSLTDAIDEANRRNKTKTKTKKTLPRYQYPMEVASPALLQKVAVSGVEFKVLKSECVPYSKLDIHRNTNKSIFGGGWRSTRPRARRRWSGIWRARSGRKEANASNISTRRPRGGPTG